MIWKSKDGWKTWHYDLQIKRADGKGGHYDVEMKRSDG